MSIHTPLIKDFIYVINLIETQDTNGNNELHEEDHIETEKELELKDLFFNANDCLNNMYISAAISKVSNYYLIKSSTFTSEVIAPPPELV